MRKVTDRQNEIWGRDHLCPNKHLQYQNLRLRSFGSKEVAAIDSRFAFIKACQHCIAKHYMYGDKKSFHSAPYFQGRLTDVGHFIPRPPFYKCGTFGCAVYKRSFVVIRIFWSVTLNLQTCIVSLFEEIYVSFGYRQKRLAMVAVAFKQ